MIFCQSYFWSVLTCKIWVNNISRKVCARSPAPSEQSLCAYSHALRPTLPVLLSLPRVTSQNDNNNPFAHATLNSPRQVKNTHFPSCQQVNCYQLLSMTVNTTLRLMAGYGYTSLSSSDTFHCINGINGNQLMKCNTRVTPSNHDYM